MKRPKQEMRWRLTEDADKLTRLERLRTELKPLMANPSYSSGQLQDLPYLSGIINEGLRLHGGVIWRSQRIAPEPLSFHEWIIPPGTPMSSSSYFTHYNEEIFPNPRRFMPERWLENKPEGEESLKKYLICFGRGTRSCMGYNLGNSMLYLTVAGIASKFDFVPFETDDRDVDTERDWSIPQPRPDSKGIRATVVRMISP
jgi:cytochrome P450